MPTKRTNQKPKRDPRQEINEILGAIQKTSPKEPPSSSFAARGDGGTSQRLNVLAQELAAQVRNVEQQRDGAEELLRSILSQCQSIMAKINAYLLAGDGRHKISE